MKYLGHSSAADSAVHAVRKGVVAVIGSSVVALGVVLIVLPGPSVLVIPLGLAILATEFLWARKLLGQIREPLRRLKAYARRTFGKPLPPAGPKFQS